VFVWAHGDFPRYAIAMLALAFGDAAGGLVGRRYGRHHFRVWGTTRSMEGSAATFIVTAVLTGIILALTMTPGGALLIGLAVGGAVAMVEAASPRGTDNITVPIAALTALAAAASSVEMAAATLAGFSTALAGVILAADVPWRLARVGRDQPRPSEL